MASKQANRYIKNRWGDDLKEKMLEYHGIKIANKQQQMISRTCGRCGYVNKLENKFCEGKGCNYPLTQLALDEIKAAERAIMQELVNKSNSERDRNQQVLAAEMQAKDQEIQGLRNQTQILSEQLATVIDQQQQHADTFDMNFQTIRYRKNWFGGSR